LEKHPAPEASKPIAKRAKAASPDPTEKVMAVLNIKAAKAQCLLKESMGDVNAAIELGLAQEESNTQVGQLIKEEREAKGTQDSPPGKGHMVIDLCDSPMETPQEDTKCLYMGTMVGTKKAKPTTSKLGPQFNKADEDFTHGFQSQPSLVDLFTMQNKKQAAATSSMQALEDYLLEAYKKAQP
jgi:hypothetical protein